VLFEKEDANEQIKKRVVEKLIIRTVGKQIRILFNTPYQMHKWEKS